LEVFTGKAEAHDPAAIPGLGCECREANQAEINLKKYKITE